MPRDPWTRWIADILTAIDKIQRYTADMAFETFRHDQRTIDAVLWNLAIIGEAARRIPPEVAAAYPDVAWVEMRGMRNVIIHQYGEVSLTIVWDTIQYDLPPLALQLRALLDSQD
ncbi:DUF86 domain-containing protein [Sphaerobacter thermophilus]|mgnify:FL=1|uniref:HepT-like ribonuclease domain-containing protein n=1 Tax=Sphaerobacter thermophilus TaxID=2057 RepID=UPI002355CA7B